MLFLYFLKPGGSKAQTQRLCKQTNENSTILLNLVQRLANSHSYWPDLVCCQICISSVMNKDILIPFRNVSGGFGATMAEQSTYNRDGIAHKALIIRFLALYRKKKIGESWSRQYIVMNEERITIHFRSIMCQASCPAMYISSSGYISLFNAHSHPVRQGLLSKLYR